MYQIKEPHHFFSDSIQYYHVMFNDIEAAKKCVLIQTYRVGYDEVGVRLKEALLRKAKAGLEVKLLIDAWGGAAVSRDFFSDLIQQGAEVRFFEKIKFNTDIFTRGHRRNHKKLILIDDEIAYIGSANFTEYSLNWRESMLRTKGGLCHTFTKAFRQDFKIYNKYIFGKAYYLRLLRHDDFEIVRDMPSITKQPIMRRYIYMIKNATSAIDIETPYFLPGYKLRKALMDAAQRGIAVKVIIPKRSDVGLVDILRNKYLGQLHEAGIQFMLYFPHNLHAKLLLIDNHIFSIGSPNFDYRSFRYMHEIVLVGTEQTIVEQVQQHIKISLENSELFNYEQWKRRSLINKFFEWLLLPFRHLL